MTKSAFIKLPLIGVHSAQYNYVNPDHIIRIIPEKDGMCPTYVVLSEMDENKEGRKGHQQLWVNLTMEGFIAKLRTVANVME